ncbi:PIN domain-containing protein [Candidatus Chloroploca sp. Khr17]|uniref:PIN domain-containing protein n=1 Tax=Candidatus Chloroploca sp. Khr17 TaxID=2496869 RepID=UPI00101B61C1|nr:PIN domain-containing protein [Candidatus Chloroploca sp. Khr17]
MTVVSDTNILSSLAAADAVEALQRLFARSTVSIPPAVRDELQAAIDRGRTYLASVIDAIAADDIPVLTLIDDERTLAATLPRRLNAGECEAIALCQRRRFPLLSNDRRAVRYCQTNGIDVVDLPAILRLFWTRQITTRADVKQIITRMEQVERLTLSDAQREAIFASQRRRR